MSERPRFPPAVIVHSLADARAALAPARPVTLLSAPGAAGFAGAGFWRALIGAAGAEAAGVPDILDCADAAGAAFAALRLGQRWLVLAAAAPGFAAVVAVAAAQGKRGPGGGVLAGGVLAEAPPALDLATPGAARRLHAWLDAADAARA